MRTYGRIYNAFWTSPDVKEFSDGAKLLAAYLLTSPHTNIVGAFRCPVDYMASDLKWPERTVRDRLRELSRNGFVSHEERFEYLVIHKYLLYNALENPKQGIAAAKAALAIPVNSTARLWLKKAFLSYGKWLPADFMKGFETVSDTVDQTLSKSGAGTGTGSGSGESIPHTPSSRDDSRRALGVAKQRRAAAAVGVLEHLNKLTGRSYEPVKSNIEIISARIEEYRDDVELVKAVVSHMVLKWKGDPKMDEYLRPATLFAASKFANYRGELGAGNKPPGRAAEKPKAQVYAVRDDSSESLIHDCDVAEPQVIAKRVSVEYSTRLTTLKARYIDVRVGGANNRFSLEELRK